MPLPLTQAGIRFHVRRRRLSVEWRFDDCLLVGMMPDQALPEAHTLLVKVWVAITDAQGKVLAGSEGEARRLRAANAQLHFCG